MSHTLRTFIMTFVLCLGCSLSQSFARPPRMPSNPCAAPPTSKLCCQAQTASCKACRANNEQSFQAWYRLCATHFANTYDCKKAPKFNCVWKTKKGKQNCETFKSLQLRSWKMTCADKLRCNKPPTLRACCKKKNKRCIQCTKRNKQKMKKWRSDCKKK